MSQSNGKTRGTCRICKIDLGYVLDVYCWTCHAKAEKALEASLRARVRQA